NAGHALVCYGDTTRGRSRHAANPSSATWQAEVNAATGNYVVQACRTGDGKILGMWFAGGAYTYYFSWHDGNSWSAEQVLENNASVRSTPYKEPFMIAPQLCRRPVSLYNVGSTGRWDTVVAWATNSGGPGRRGIPASDINVFFDANSVSNCVLTKPAAVNSLNTTGYTNTLSIGTNNLGVAGNLVHGGGTITIGSSAGAGLDVEGSITNAAVLTCAGASKIYCAGDWDGSDGIFNAGSSAVVLDGSAPFDTTDDGLGTVSAQVMGATPAGEDMLKAFDNNLATKWLDFATNNPVTRASWIQYRYAGGDVRVVVNYTVSSANDFPERDPRDWRLLGSNNGGTSWDTLDTRTGQFFSARFETQSFSFSNSTAYNIYRLQIDSVYGPGSANSVQLSELELNEVTGHGQRVTTGGAWDPAATNNNWKNNWSTLEVKNVSTGGVVFLDGFKAAQLVATQSIGSVLYFAPQLGVTNVYKITDSNGLKLSGGPAPSNFIKLRRYGGGVGDRWEIYPSDPGGAWAVNYVNVADSVNSASNAIMPVSYTDGGNTLNWFAPTCVALGWFRAIGRNNSVTIRWKTEAEINTAGFNLYRSSAPDGAYVKVNPNFIWGLGTSSRGREYKFVDDNVVNGMTYYYKLEEVEFSGRTALHGPVAAHPGLDSDGDGLTDDWENIYGLNPALNDAAADPDGDGQTNYQEFLADTNPFICEGEDGGGWSIDPEGVPGGDTGIYKLTVITNGIYRITAGYLENSAGVTNLSEWAMDSIRVYNQGVEIPLHVKDDGAAGFGTNDYFEFYGAGLDTRFTDANIYWLYHATNAAGSALRMAGVAGAGENPLASVGYTERFERNETYQDELPDETPDDDHWFFSDMLVATNSPSDPVELHPVLADVSAEAGTAGIRVALRAINCLSAHRIRVNLNGTDLEEGYWEGYGQYVYSAETSQTNLVEGTNTITLVLAGDTGAALEQVLVNWAEIDYLKSLRASGNMLMFPSAEPEGVYICDGFSTNDLQVFRVAGATNVAIITNTVVSGAGPFTVEFADTLAAGETNITFAVLAPSAALVPAAIAEDASAGLRSTLNGADYIIIAHDAFTNAVRPLADFRSAQGLRVKAVGIQDVYDDFSFGIATPYAIRDFMIYARANWRKPAPAFLLLAGDASYDYRNYEDMGSVNFVPAKLVHDSNSLEAPSDNWFVALDGGDDYLPDMYVGRLPARTADEAAEMADKIIGYESAAVQDWAGKVMLAADNEAQFEAISEAVYNRLPAGYKARCEKIYLASNSVATCQAALTNGINAGALIAHYAGHGSIRLWADEYLFQVSDLESLTNSAALPFFVTPTCWNGYFIYPPDYDYEGLAEELLRKPAGGACACFSPSGLSVPPHQKLIVENLFGSIFGEGAFALGPAMTRAKFKTHENIQDSSRNVVQIFTLFGDPAMRLKQWAGYTNEAAAPEIVLTLPLDGARNVEPLAEIRITFSAAMDDVMTRAAFSVEPQIEGTLCWEGTTLVFQPEDSYSLATVYTVTINSNACDLAGNRLSCDYSFVFARTYPAGTLAIAVTPSSGSWRMASCPVSYHGALSSTGGLAAAAAPEGAYVVAYGELPGYTAPCAQNQTVYRGISTAFAGVYNRHPDFTEGSVITQRYGEADLPGGIAFALHASDAEGESLAWSFRTAAAHGTASLAGSGSARIVSYRPQEGYRGTDSFALQVADPAGGTGKITVNILFNNPPGIHSIPAQTVELGNALTFEVSAADPDGTAPALSMPEGPPGAAFSDRGNGSGVFTWTPSAAGDLGGHTARFSASDGHLSGTTVVSIDVTSFAVTSPAAGDVARHGGDLCVAWSGARALGTVAVDLWRGTNFVLNLTSGLPSPSSRMTWHYTVPVSLRPGREYL
ncbi:MAG: C25 family cysteine peptidase, partial [Kiritimatiellia bacterium]